MEAVPDVVFELPDPSLAAYTWLYENEHGPVSQPPLLRSGPFGARSEGDGPPRRLVVNGYTYFRHDPSGVPSPFPDGSADARTPLALWREKWSPQVDAVFDALITFDPQAVPAGAWEETLQAAAAEFGRVFGGVHGECVMTSGIAAERFVDGYAARFGEDRRADALALLQGFPNRTLDRAEALWDLGRAVGSDHALRASLEADRRAVPAEGAFGERFTAFLQDFGYTVDMMVQDQPSWLEDPSPAIALILRYAAEPDAASPAAAAERQRRRRLELEAELRAAAQDDAIAADLLAQLPAAQELLPVREDHNTLCDQRLSAASRLRWLRVGEHLQTLGAASRSDDVFYYALDELYPALEGGPALPPGEIARHRELQAAFRATSPPPVLGQPPEQPAAGEASGRLRFAGTAASPGIYRGTARVIRSLGEADRLGDGEVLVCGVTAPAWTPYFAIAGAVVTDAGGALSHTAVVAREYGIPAVVGTRDGSRRIADGATIEVDGGAGTVTVIEG